MTPNKNTEMEKKIEEALLKVHRGGQGLDIGASIIPARNAILEAIHSRDMEIITKLNKYKCDFNWDYEKDKPKHKSYIALDTVLSLLQEETK